MDHTVPNISRRGQQQDATICSKTRVTTMQTLTSISGCNVHGARIVSLRMTVRRSSRVDACLPMMLLMSVPVYSMAHQVCPTRDCLRASIRIAHHSRFRTSYLGIPDTADCNLPYLAGSKVHSWCTSSCYIERPRMRSSHFGMNRNTSPRIDRYCFLYPV